MVTSIRTSPPLNAHPAKLTWSFVLFVVAHATITVGALLVAFSLGISRFDSGGDVTLFERAAEAVLAVFSFPLLVLFDHLRGSAQWFPGFLGYIPVIANSAVWAIALCFALHRRSLRRRERPSDG